MSEIRANTVSNAAGTGPATLTGQYAAKAWVNFNGTGTVAIRESGNVSSITDNGTGVYTSNFTNAMTDANYSWQSNTGTNGSTFSGMRLGFNNTTAPSTTALRIEVQQLTAPGAGSVSDMAAVTVSIVR